MTAFRTLGAALLTATAMLSGGTALAQYDKEEAMRTWQEGAVPAAPSFSSRNMVEVAQRPYSTLKVGVDVDTITVGATDGVVRYVMLFKGQDGTRNAYYQGVRCTTHEIRTYARYDFDTNAPGWIETNTEWSSLFEARSRYANDLVRKGLCDNMTPPVSTAEARRAVRRGNASWMNPDFGTPSR